MFSPEHCKRPRLNLVLPTVNPKEVFGGISTALKIFEELKIAFEGALDVRVIVTETHISAVTDSLKGYHIQQIGAEEYAKEVLLGAKERTDKHLQLRPNDIFVGTAWWTALNCFRAHDAQKSFFGEAPKVIYLMQDFEPDFYGWSTRYSLAEATYLRGNDTIALMNSEELMQHFASKYHHPHKLVIPYAINSNIDASLTHSVRDKIILFYARPSTVRNCFEAGVDGLALWARRNPAQASQWKVYCIGEEFSSNLVQTLPNCIITGKMSLEEYASLLSRASVGLSLMVSPHPSYPPLEMAYSGVRTVTNRYPGKDLSSRSDYIKSIQIPTPDLIAPAIEEQVRIAEQEMIGKVTPIRNIIRDIPVDVNSYTAEETLRLLLGTS